MDMNLSKLWLLGIDRKAWHAAVHVVTKSRTWLSYWTEVNSESEARSAGLSSDLNPMECSGAGWGGQQKIHSPGEKQDLVQAIH